MHFGSQCACPLSLCSLPCPSLRSDSWDWGVGLLEHSLRRTLGTSAPYQISLRALLPWLADWCSVPGFCPVPSARTPPATVTV